MTTQSIVYGTRTALTATLNSLVNLSNRESNAIDNTSTLAVDYVISVTLKTGTSPSAGGLIYVWIASSDGTDWTGGATGSDSSYTAGEEWQLQPLQVFTVSATSNVVYKQVTPSLATYFGGTVPPKFSLIIENQSGAALNASSNGIEYTSIKYTYA